MKPAITLRILSHNRPNFLIKALESAFLQEKPFAQVELYDNASNFSLESLLERFPELILKSSQKLLSSGKNAFRAFSDPPPTPWLCVFHDDDLLSSGFVINVSKAISDNPNILAVSCNGEVIDHQGNLKNEPLIPLQQDYIIKNPADLGCWYCNSYIPFSPTVYLWQPELIQDHAWAADYGRCADVALLSQVISRGPIYLSAKKSFYYRRHDNQDSSGFLWWEETKRWQLQLELCRENPTAWRYVDKKRRARLTSRWLNAWFFEKLPPEAWNWSDFSLSAAHRFVRNKKIKIAKRLFWLRKKS